MQTPDAPPVRSMAHAAAEMDGFGVASMKRFPSVGVLVVFLASSAFARVA